MVFLEGLWDMRLAGCSSQSPGLTSSPERSVCGNEEAGSVSETNRKGRWASGLVHLTHMFTG
jgi:hypothetical protein